MLTPLSFFNYLAQNWAALASLATSGLEDGLHISFPFVHLIDWVFWFLFGNKGAKKDKGNSEVPAMYPRT